MKKLFFILGLLISFVSQAQYRVVQIPVSPAPTTGQLVHKGSSGTNFEMITPQVSLINGLQDSLNLRQYALVSGTSIKTINSAPVLGSGDITLQTPLSGTGYAKWSGSTPSYVASIPVSDLTLSSLDIPAADFFGWSGRSRIRSSADGYIALYNNAETGFTGLRFGGVGATFPSLRANGTQLEVKAADNSDFTNFKSRISTVTESFNTTNQSANLSTPSTGMTRFYTTKLGGGVNLTIVDDDGNIFDVSKSIYTNHKALWWPSASNTAGSITVLGTGASIQGTATARAVTTTDAISQMNRVGFSTGAAASGGAGIRHNSVMYFRGNAANTGGFYAKWKVMYSSASIAGRMAFIGFCSQGSVVIVAGTDPTTLPTMVGFVAKIATSNNWMVYANDASGNATLTVDLGANFPANTNNTDAYDMRLYCKPNDTKLTYWIKNMTSGNVATGDITTDLPAATTLMGWHVYITNGATASADIIDIFAVEVEKFSN